MVNLQDKIRGNYVRLLKQLEIDDIGIDFKSFVDGGYELAKILESGYVDTLYDKQGLWLLYENFKEIYLQNKNKFNDKTKKLAEVLSQQEVENYKDNFMSFLSQLPKEYNVYFKLPSSDLFDLTLVEVTEEISIVRVPSKNKSNKDNISSMLGSYYRDDDNGGIYVKIKSNGYANGFNTSAVQAAFQKFKYFIYIAWLKGCYNNKYSYVSALHAYHEDSEGSDRRIDFKLPYDAQEFAKKLELKKDVLIMPVGLFGSLSDEPRPLDTQALKRHLGDGVQYLLRSSEDDEETIQLKAGINWAFDALINQNETFSFVQACIAIEAILGSSNPDESLTKSIINRCVYLLGESVSERKALAEDVREIYKIRSKIVHGSRKKLKNKEIQYFNKAREILNKIIVKEIARLEKLLPKENKNGKLLGISQLKLNT